MTPRLTLVMARSSALFDLPDLARRAVAGGVDRVQVRERDLGEAELSRLVSDVAAAVGPEHVAVNDQPELAARLGVHLHLPERSIARFSAAGAARSVSASVHSPGAAATLPPGIGHVVAGHVYPTARHPDIPPIGPAGLSEIVGASAVPVIAIGGIDPSNLDAVVHAGAAGVAVLTYVNSSHLPDRAARELRDALEHAMSNLATSIAVHVNGKPMSVPPGTTIAAFLEGRNLHPRLVVVERNGEITAKSAYESTVLEEGDLLEIAHFVGGG